MTTGATPTAKSGGLRLSIAHLLCWIAASALGFAAYQRISPTPLRLGPALVVGVYNLVMGMALGTILTGVGIMAYRRWRDGMSYPSSPGHWLLMLGLAAALSEA